MHRVITAHFETFPSPPSHPATLYVKTSIFQAASWKVFRLARSIKGFWRYMFGSGHGYGMDNLEALRVPFEVA